LLIAVALFGAGLLTLFSMQRLLHIDSTGVSSAPHFIYQARSFLEGRWDIDLSPATTDVVVVHGKSYIVYPPLPALLLLPFVALFGLHTSDILFTAVLSAANLGLLFLVLEQASTVGLARRNWTQNMVISLSCWLGSITLTLSLGGWVWFTEHIVAMTCTLFALLFALHRRFTWSALWLGCAVFSRAPLLLAFPLLFFLAWQESPADNLFARVGALLSTRPLCPRLAAWPVVPWRRLSGPMLVLGLVLLLFLARNWVVFGSPFESGYNMLVQQRYPQVQNGLFSLSYVPENVFANFLTFPRVQYSNPFDRTPHIDWVTQGVGTSVFFTTPLFLLLFWRNHHFSPVRAALWVVIGLIVACALLFLATGWVQFGARYLFDAYPFAFLLLAINDIRIDWRFGVLGLLGVLVNLLGAAQFWHS
jgi:hypothetical protein